jgi:hypothetical protein
VLGFSLDLPGAIRSILQLRPQTRRVFVVLGSSPLELFWAEQAARLFREFDDRIEFEYSVGMNSESIVKHVAGRPPESAVFHGLMFRGGNGVRFEEDWALNRLRKATSVPIFSLYRNQLGLAADAALLGFWSVDIGTRDLWASGNCRNLLDLPAETALTPETLIAASRGDDPRWIWAV